MIVATTPYLTGYQVTEVKGQVFGQSLVVLTKIGEFEVEQVREELIVFHEFVSGVAVGLAS